MSRTKFSIWKKYKEEFSKTNKIVFIEDVAEDHSRFFELFVIGVLGSDPSNMKNKIRCTKVHGHLYELWTHVDDVVYEIRKEY